VSLTYKGLSKLLLKSTAAGLLPPLYPPIRSDKPILNPGPDSSWDEKDVHSIHVIRDRDGKYWLFYNSLPREGENKGIGLAESDDGFVFTKNPNNPVIKPASADSYIWKCQAFKIGTEFRIIYAEPPLGKRFYRTSTDGVNWSDAKETNVKLNPMIYDNYTGRLYVVRFWHGKWGFGVSEDWLDEIIIEEEPEPLDLRSWDGRQYWGKYVLRHGTLYMMWYEGEGMSSAWQIGVAYSYDLRRWLRDPRNPILGPGYPGDFDAGWVADPSVIIDEGVIRVYYGASDGKVVPPATGYAGLALIPTRPYIRGFFRTDWSPWDDRNISADETSDMVTCAGYRQRTIHFYSDTAGTLTIEHRTPSGTWKEYDSISNTAKEIYPLGADVEAIRIKFDTAAKVTAWWEFTA